MVRDRRTPGKGDTRVPPIQLLHHRVRGVDAVQATLGVRPVPGVILLLQLSEELVARCLKVPLEGGSIAGILMASVTPSVFAPSVFVGGGEVKIARHQGPRLMARPYLGP